MKCLLVKKWFWLIFFVAFSSCDSEASKNEGNNTMLTKTEDTQLTYILPSPKIDGSISVEKALANRRSQRQFQNKAISADQLSQILWAAYGITSPMPNHPHLRGGFRTVPSAGAAYPFEIYVAVGKVKGIEHGVYKYFAKEHKIVRILDKDVRNELYEAGLRQEMLKEAPATVIYTAIFSRMTDRYGERGRERYVCMDLGHSAQNIYLQAEALCLGTCAVGAFNDSRVSQVLQMSENEEPLYIMPLGNYYK